MAHVTAQSGRYAGTEPSSFLKGSKDNQAKENTYFSYGKGLPKGQLPLAYAFTLPMLYRESMYQRKTDLTGFFYYVTSLLEMGWSEDSEMS